MGSMHGVEPMMLLMVAVGAMAITLLFRIPWDWILLRRVSQSSLPPLGTSIAWPRSFSRRSTVSGGRRPRCHLLPS